MKLKHLKTFEDYHSGPDFNQIFKNAHHIKQQLHSGQPADSVLDLDTSKDVGVQISYDSGLENDPVFDQIELSQVDIGNSPFYEQMMAELPQAAKMANDFVSGTTTKDDFETLAIKVTCHCWSLHYISKAGEGDRWCFVKGDADEEYSEEAIKLFMVFQAADLLAYS